MDGVGTDQGVVNRQRQGTGLATILQGDSAVDTYRQVYQNEYATLQRRDAERKARKDASMAKLSAINPEYFYKHQDELQPAINKLHEDGAALLEQNIDPFNDPRARQWQKDYATVMAMSNASNQIKEQFTGLRKVLVETGPDEYRAQDISAAMDFFDLPLSQIVNEGLTAPMLQKKKPFTDMNEFVGKQMTEWQRATGAEPDDNAIADFIDASAKQPANTEKYIVGYGSKFNQLDPDEQKRVKDAATMNGREVWQQLAFEDAKRWQKTKTPLDIQKEFADAAAMALKGIGKKEVHTPTGWSSKPVGKEEAVAAAANITFNNDPRWMKVFDKEGELPRLKEETDGEYAVRVKKYLADQIRPFVGTNTEYGKTEKGEGDKKMIDSRNAFLEDIKSGDWRRMQGAANILVGTTYSGNMRVENATVTQGPDNFWLDLDLTTPLSVKDVKEQIVSDTGVSSDSVTVEERQGHKVVTISLAPDAVENQTFIRLHDNTVKQTGEPYSTKYTERTPTTALDALKSTQYPTTPIPKPAAGGYDQFFK